MQSSMENIDKHQFVWWWGDVYVFALHAETISIRTQRNL